ncbi:MAG: hypothetical protein PHQ75_05495 [Thermoguttaceae bacterium]|nr:hypothetical protein [Thermoguttaceae bacterium]
MKKLFVLSFVLSLLHVFCSLGMGQEKTCPIYPVPKECQVTGATWPLRADAVIVLGDKATEVERYAAQRLQTHVKLRYKTVIPIIAEKEVSAQSQLFLVGCVDSNTLLAKELQGTFSQSAEKSSTAKQGPDSFVIRFVKRGDIERICVGANHSPGVIYGQEALFDLFGYAQEKVEGKAKSKIVLTVANVRDWPSIPWRGRPHLVLRQQLVPGVLDCYAHYRINYTDVRDNPKFKVTNVYPDRAAPMGFPAGVPLDVVNVKKMIDESHRRGMFVYGCVASAAELPSEKENSAFANKVLGTFQELIDLKVDGLWISFDDIGSGGDPSGMIRKILAFGKQHGMTGRKIAYTPPLGDYQVIDRPYNREAAKIPEFDAIQWYFTRVPCKADAAMAREIGLKILPAWWHNLVGLRGGFLHNQNIAVSLRVGDKPAYVELQSLAAGWGSPDYEKIRDAAKNTDNVMIWGICGGWPEEYLIGALGLWAWAPETHDWARTQKEIYTYVYGPACWETAKAFDDKLVELKTLFNMPVRKFEPNNGWPCRLKNKADREKALAMIDELDAMSQKINQGASQGSAVDQSRLESIYLEPMRTTVDYARRMAKLDYPEELFEPIQEKLRILCDGGKRAEAASELAKITPKILRRVGIIENELKELKGIDGYAAFWRRQVEVGYWEDLLGLLKPNNDSKWKKIIAAPLRDIFPIKADQTQTFEAMTKNVSVQPEGKILSTLGPEAWSKKNWRARGAFAVGQMDIAGRKFIGIGFPRSVASKKDDFGSISTSVELPKGKEKVFAKFFITDTRIDNMYRGYSFVEILVDGKIVWSNDVVANQTGKEWISIPLPSATKTRKQCELVVRLRHRRAVGSFPSIVMAGPVYLEKK